MWLLLLLCGIGNTHLYPDLIASYLSDAFRSVSFIFFVKRNHRL